MSFSTLRTLLLPRATLFQFNTVRTFSATAFALKKIAGKIDTANQNPTNNHNLSPAAAADS
jgi:hypothetical protein